jgi:hypothetical protein
MELEINSKTDPNKILKHFRECGSRDSVNLKTENGFIYLVGGILNKLEGAEHFIAIKGRWVKV